MLNKLLLNFYADSAPIGFHRRFLFSLTHKLIIEIIFKYIRSMAICKIIETELPFVGL